MSKVNGYIKKEDRKTILLLCDDIRMHSGIGTMAREFVVNTAHRYNWVNLGAGINHPDAGKALDLSADVNKKLGIEDSSVLVLPNNGYGDPVQVRGLMERFKPDAIYIFTDPRYWVWLFQMEREIRSQIPIFWLNIWDDYPSPLYNKEYYDSVDLLMGISKQTVNVNKLVLGEKADSKLLKYIPHGIDHEVFKPLDKTTDEFKSFKKDMFKDKEIDFVVFFNSRNIHRKRPADVIFAYRIFCDMIGPDAYKKTALLMHTNPVDANGTDLSKVKEALTTEDMNVFFSKDKLSPNQMNFLYNVADATALISSNEGWGLSLTESMLAGTMIIPNVTGGMQDQCRFENEKGEWIDFDADFPSNHRGTYKKCGEWVAPVFPSNISVAGSVPTPYIFDDRCTPEDVALAIKSIYDLSPEERASRGLKGREWAMSDEAKMTSKAMSENISNAMEEAFENFVPRPDYDLIKTEPLEKLQVTHKLYNY
jgi:glycosyltransferase involved in cell wall biosynthesis